GDRGYSSAAASCAAWPVNKTKPTDRRPWASFLLGCSLALGSYASRKKLVRVRRLLGCAMAMVLRDWLLSQGARHQHCFAFVRRRGRDDDSDPTGFQRQA